MKRERTYDEVQEAIANTRSFLALCASHGKGCGPCRNARETIAKLELEHGTVHPDNRAKSSGALAR